ncbi:site-specific integrase [Companilactobacillus sp. RD055328]|uniref:tyrosine-type recombinase/integrase n=1 Tax=Companilactobacillus sp. RD055328 TaxID=2916634 RepID=UPI001FC82DC8|nr:site-specific integrase [Companilactobacillus sp. RD055328]GKQ42957.1 site-specific integrase [Companilactobacillus sp. RD055328]
MSVKKLPNKKWQARVSVKVGGEFRTKNGNFKTKAEALDFEREWKGKEASGIELSKQDITLPEYMREFIDLYKSSKSERTQEIYEGSYKKILGKFKGRKLVNITRADIQKYMNEFGKHHAITTSKKLFQHLHQTITSAINDGIITRDICAHIEVTGNDPVKAEEKYLEFEDYLTLLQYLYQEANYNRLYMEFALFALQTGCRFSEISGVKVSDLDFKKNTITIQRQWIERKKKSGSAKGNGSSDRIIAVSKPFMNHLEYMLEEREQSLISNNIKDNDYLFLTNEGLHLQNDSCNKNLHGLLKKLNIKRINMHGMRHTHATLLIYRHRDPWYIAKRLGHASIKELDRTYGHVFHKMDAENDKFVMNDFGHDLIDTPKNKIIPLK